MSDLTIARRRDEEELLAVARRVAVAAGALLLGRFAQPATGVASKTTVTDLVSDADREAEALITRLLQERRPRDGIVGEEGARREGDSGLRWLVDPLDGTINYLFGVPHWCVSIACVDDSGAVAGVIHDACRGETFAALRGVGAWLGDRELHVTAEEDLGRALVATGFAYDAELRRRQAETVLRVLPRVRDIRRFGSAALDLAWVGAGRFDAYFESGVKRWDVAAGSLLVREAGGEVSEVERIGSDARPGVVATNGKIHRALRALLE